jgi:adenosylcobinamide kinase / adenosylcobinamide-phosphate guanylyltransferase
VVERDEFVASPAVITLVLGGARSGKSAVAERLAARAAPPVTYIATGSADGDADMAARIAAHRARRPDDWSTIEAGAQLATALAGAPDGTVLVDALGTWVAAHADLAPDVAALVAALDGRRGDTIIVSEEVGLGVHPSSETGRRFRDVLGETNTTVAAIADEVLLVVAGRALKLPAE